MSKGNTESYTYLDSAITASFDEERYWSIVGDNGFGMACHEAVLIEGIRKFRNVSIMEFPSEELARRYAYAAYFCRFVMRNAQSGISPKIPVNLPMNQLFIDPDFEAREGNRHLAYFPGIPL